MALTETGIAIVEPTLRDVSTPASRLTQAISDLLASYRGPIQTPVGKALWAIQAWYAELGDEVRAEGLLADLTQQQSAHLVSR